MDEGVDLCCYYYNKEEQTLDRLSYWWYMRYLWGSTMLGLGYDVTAAGDPDGDGFINKEEHDEATDPVDDASFPFRIDAFSPTNLSFRGSVKGRLIVERCDRLGGEWSPVHVDDSPRTSTSNAVGLTSTATNGFYRVRHRAD